MTLTTVVSEDLPITWELITVLVSVIATTMFLTWFVRNQFAAQTRLFFRIISRHNREDDDRFQLLSDDIWNIHLHLAQQDGGEMPKRKSLPRRRYLVEDVGGDDDAAGGDTSR